MPKFEGKKLEDYREYRRVFKKIMKELQEALAKALTKKGGQSVEK